MSNNMKKILPIIFVLISCNDDLKYGNITQKVFHPEYDYTTMYFMDMGNGVQVPMTQYWHQDESWSIDVKGTTKEGKIGNATYYIPREQWDTLKLGQFVCVDGMCDTDSNLHEIKK